MGRFISHPLFSAAKRKLSISAMRFFRLQPWFAIPYPLVMGATLPPPAGGRSRMVFRE
jgi:hypothetical protein